MKLIIAIVRPFKVGRQRQDIFKAEDEIMVKRDSLVESLERRLAQHTATDMLFTIRWEVA